MKQLLESDQPDFFIDLFDWNFDDLFENSFHQFIDTTISESSNYINEILPENNQSLSYKETKKLFSEYNKFLWQLSDNRFKYCFLFDFKQFLNFIATINDLEYDFIKKSIFSFRTKELIDYLSSNISYNQFLLSIVQNKCR